LGGKSVLGGKDICFYHMFKTNFFEHKKIWGPQKRFGGTSSECTPVSAGLGTAVARKSSTGGIHVCAGARSSPIATGAF